MNIYQILVRLFHQNTTNKFSGSLVENGCGKMNYFTSTILGHIKALGITHIWYTGIIRHTTTTTYSQYSIPTDHPHLIKGRAGSPYAIVDYFDVHPDLAKNIPDRMREFEQLLARTQQAGMGVIIDFVPNHVARSYRSIAKPIGVKDLGSDDISSKAFHPHNNFYYLPNTPLQLPTEAIENCSIANLPAYKEKPARATGNDCFSANPSYLDWYETTKLNYGIDYLHNGSASTDDLPNTWVKMKEILTFWAKKGVDGFRCDMVEMVPLAFWQWVIPSLKTMFPKLIFIAEIYNPHNYQGYIERGKFDYLYDKVGFYDAALAVMRGEKSPDELQYFVGDSYPLAKHMLRFLENHDEQRLASTLLLGSASKAFPAITAAFTMSPSANMLYFGQELGEAATQASGFSKADGKTTIFDYWGLPTLAQWITHCNAATNNSNDAFYQGLHIRNFYRKLLDLCKQNVIKTGDTFVLQKANYNNLNYSQHHLLSYIRYTASTTLLFVLNFDNILFRVTNLIIPLNVWDAIALPNEITIYNYFDKSKKKAVKKNRATRLGIHVVLPRLGIKIYVLS